MFAYYNNFRFYSFKKSLQSVLRTWQVLIYIYIYIYITYIYIYIIIYIYTYIYIIYMTYFRVFSGHVGYWWPWTCQEMRPGLFQKTYVVCNSALACFQLLRCFVELVFNFLASFCFNFCIEDFLSTISQQVLESRSDFWDGAIFAKINTDLKPVIVFAEISVLDVWKGS